MMDASMEGSGSRACWFVGASFGGTDDQTARFLSEGIWENGYKDKYLDMVKSAQEGDRIAIKSTYTRKHNLPFDNRGQIVSVMAIKAIGTVTHNPGDGRSLKVDWIPLDPPREWYFYTGRTTVWRVEPGNWCTDGLIEFAFQQKPQDMDRFRNAPFWQERFGDRSSDKKRFKWTGFYEAVADKLLNFRNRRHELVAKIHEIGTRVDGLSILQDQFSDGTAGPMRDICPFTAMGIFNRGITDANRMAIAAELREFLGVTEPVPESFEAIPILNNQRSWFYGYEKKRLPDDIDILWEVFSRALRFPDSDDGEARSAFLAAYDTAAGRFGVGWNLTMGLFWIRPWSFLTLDGQSRHYITKKLGMEIGHNGPKGRCNGEEYLKLVDALEARFQEDAFSVHSFPELSLAAWLFKDDGKPIPVFPADPEAEEDETETAPEEEIPLAPIQPYSLDNVLEEGCFLERARLATMLDRLRTKRNLILQGPPGTGKTWLARRLAFALMGQRDESKLRAVQFHANLSYEDFVRGWRPGGDGKLALVDGPLLEMVKSAVKAPTVKYVMVIEEINRGNPAQIFGEMLTLLEVDKRTPDEALELCYRQEDGERVYVPDNLYLLGTMNIADRSLALVDLALRRRFAFIDLEPVFGERWRDWVNAQCGVPIEALLDIEKRMEALNADISADTRLGPQFRVGHSYVTPPFGCPIADARDWFQKVVETEIGPLLNEYWFDSPQIARKAQEQLLQGL